MENKKDLFFHIALRHLRDIKHFIETDSNEHSKSEYRAIAQNDITELWLYDFITQNTRNLLTTWLYSI